MRFCPPSWRLSRSCTIGKAMFQEIAAASVGARGASAKAKRVLRRWKALSHWLRAGVTLLLFFTAPLSVVDAEQVSLDHLIGQPANIAGSAYSYRADRPADANPPEAWILL